MRTIRTAFFLACTLSLLPGGAHEAQQTGKSFAVRNVRVFDGAQVLPRGTVVVLDGVIAAVGADAKVPDNIPALDGAGQTLLPGFIDAHTHTRDTDALESALAFGVTTQLDMNTLPEFAAARRREQAEGRAHARADLFSAGTGVTTPGGHGSRRFGSPPPMLSRPEEADEFVRARLAEGSDFIKVIVDDGRMWDRTQPTLDRSTVEAVVAAARKYGTRAIAHTVTLDDARAALAAGIDGFVHVWVDREPDPPFLDLMRRRRVFITPTLAVWKSGLSHVGAGELLRDPRIDRFATAAQVQQLSEPGQLNPERRTPARYENAAKSVAALSRAGIAILAGADAPNPGTTYGISLHHELQLLVEAGLTPVQALVAATSAPAEAFGLRDRGRIEVDRRADLVLVEGDPLTDITRTRQIVGIWKAGDPFAREEYAKKAAARRTLATGAAAVGVLSDFETGTPSTRVGGQWLASADALAGGKSSAALDVVPAGADGSAHALRITADVIPGIAQPWAGVIAFPAGAAAAPVNLSAASGLRFAVRGTPGTYRVVLGGGRDGRANVSATFRIGLDWQTVALQWSDFDGLDPSRVIRLSIVAGPEPGRYVFEIDNVEIR